MSSLDNRTSETLTYFAYGSNMCTARLKERVSSAVPMGVARLPGYALKFHKRSKDGSGKCNVVLSNDGGAEVVGVLFRISASERPALDDAEGLGRGYHDVRIQVFTDQGPVPCFLYVADDDATDDKEKPYAWYKEFVIAGAKEHRLSPDYVAGIETVASIPDPQPVRAAKNRAILSKAVSGKSQSR